MVRIKHRYLLVQILYPDPFPLSSKPSSSKPNLPSSSAAAAPLPNVVRFHQPSPDDLTPQVLARAIRDQIALLYGDYGVGMTATSLNGKIMNALFYGWRCRGGGGWVPDPPPSLPPEPGFTLPGKPTIAHRFRNPSFRAVYLIKRGGGEEEPLGLTMRARYSQISLPGNLDRHRAMRARPLPAGLGGSFLHDPAPFPFPLILLLRRRCLAAVRVSRRAGVWHD